MQILILISVFSYWFAALSGIPGYVKNVLFKFGIKKDLYKATDTTGSYYVPIRLYPLDCEKCLAFWLGITYYWGQGFYTILLAGCCSALAIFTGLLVTKLR